MFASLGGSIIISITKELFGRVRPDVVPQLIFVDTLSFPSGHASISAMVYLAIAIILGRMAVNVRSYCVFVAVFISILVAFSRVYLGVHYPTDVIAGLFLGYSWALTSYLLAELFNRKLS